VTSERVKELEERIADLRRRWPPHSVPPQMLEQQLDAIQSRIAELDEKKVTKEVDCATLRIPLYPMWREV
jgi:TolA-binding protein